MRVRGFFKKLPLTILIESGSTHNFIDPRIAKQANCFIHPCSSFEVMIANGGTLPCKGKCHNVHISMGDYNLRSDMFSLPLGECDVVLGAQWLHTLRLVLWILLNFGCSFQSMGKNKNWRDYNQSLLATSIHIAWKISLRRIHMVSSYGSISFSCNLQRSPLLPWIFHSDATLRRPIFPSPSLLRVMLVTMELVFSSFRMNIPFHSWTNPFLVWI